MKRTTRRHPTIAARAALALAMSALTLLLAACGGDAGGGSDGADADPVHVHGLGVNPADSALYIATHTGLFRMEEGSDRSERVGDRRQDTMGFTVLGPDHFLGSGHPDLRDDLPPLLGLIESSDGGRSWESISLLGEADFHALRATGSLVHGYDASGERLMLSGDGGRTWTTRRPPGPLADVVVDPDDPDHLVAAGQAGLLRSPDGGRTWSPLGAPPGLLAWPTRDALYAVSFDGRALLSSDGGGSWSPTGRVAGEPAALTAADSRTLIVALHDGGFANSSDGGRTWKEGAWPT
jgi:photosystem II stability/assembly factor-like uncharacterized protein